MLNGTKRLLALLICVNLMQFGVIAAALENDEDQGAATGGSTEGYQHKDEISMMNMVRSININLTLHQVQVRRRWQARAQVRHRA